MEFAKPFQGQKKYQMQARKALPILVRQAEAGQSLTYSDLADEIEVLDLRNMGKILGTIGEALQNLSRNWASDIPPIQCIVINKNTGLPGAGIGWFISNHSEWSELSQKKKRARVNTELSRIFSYPKWHDVLKAFKLNPVQSSFTAINMLAAEPKIGGGESERHKLMKLFIAENPKILGLAANTPKGSTEKNLPSGDSLDVSFQLRKKWIAAEVKTLISSDADLVRGLYQCVKYRAVMTAWRAAEGEEESVEAILVTEGKFPKSLIALKNILGVRVVDQIKISFLDDTCNG